jgi:hypothetical protein
MTELREWAERIDQLTERQMKLLTAKNLKQLPELYSTEKDRDPMVWVKFFNPYGRGTWFATEFDGKDTFFGYVMGIGGDELGYFSLSELKRIRAEREDSWKPMKLSQAKAYERKIHGLPEEKEEEGEGEELSEAVAQWIWANDGDLEFALSPFDGQVQIGMGGEWWNGKLKGTKTVFNHRKQRVDPAYAPVTVEVTKDGNDFVFDIKGGFGGMYEKKIKIGKKG